MFGFQVDVNPKMVTLDRKENVNHKENIIVESIRSIVEDDTVFLA